MQLEFGNRLADIRWRVKQYTYHFGEVGTSAIQYELRIILMH